MALAVNLPSVASFSAVGVVSAGVFGASALPPFASVPSFAAGEQPSPIAPIAEMPARAPVPFKKLRRESSIMKPLLVVEGQCMPLPRFGVFGIRIAQSLPCFACLV